MRGVVITQAGGPEYLEVRDLADPVPGRNELLVRVHASALNRADILQREGRYPPPPGAPDVPGMEFAGEVIGLGSGASRWKIGARVFGIVSGGSHAELLTVHEEQVAPVPDDMSWTDAGAIPEAFITAHDAMVTQAGVASGERVLIHAVASGVGLAATQIARAWNAIPYGTTRTASKVDVARAHGLEDGIVLDRDPLGPAVEKWTAGQGMNVTLDLVGGPYFVASVKSAALKGRILLIGSLAGATAEFPLGMVLRKRIRIIGTVLRARSLEEKIDATQRFAREIVPLFANGTLKPTIDSVFPLDRIADAHRRMESNQTTGKVVITM